MIDMSKMVPPKGMGKKEVSGKQIVQNAEDIVADDDIAVMWIKGTDQIQIYVKPGNEIVDQRQDRFAEEAINGVKLKLASGQLVTVGFLFVDAPVAGAST